MRRSSNIILTGITLKDVAVGTSRLDSMLSTMRAATPFIFSVCAPVGTTFSAALAAGFGSGFTTTGFCATGVGVTASSTCPFVLATALSTEGAIWPPSYIDCTALLLEPNSVQIRIRGSSSQWGINVTLVRRSPFDGAPILMVNQSLKYTHISDIKGNQNEGKYVLRVQFVHIPDTITYIPHKHSQTQLHERNIEGDRS